MEDALISSTLEVCSTCNQNTMFLSQIHFEYLQTPAIYIWPHHPHTRPVQNYSRRTSSPETIPASAEH